VAEMRRTTRPLAGDLQASVEELAASIRREFTNERLHELIEHGGWDPASPGQEPS